MFIEEVDPLTGEITWRVESEYYDLAQEIARSRFGDMLHDIERNHLYQSAIHSVIKQMREHGETVNIVDIGTGTGLLAMMAAQAGATSVTAVEMFKPMADCAKTVFCANGFQDSVTLISQRSTDLQPYPDDMKANCIVAEVFDTELIGEGALRTFKEAHETLAKSYCRVIPSSAKVMIAPVKSDFLKKFHHLPDRTLRCPLMNCAGSAVFDVQLSNVSPEDVQLLCGPFEIFRFDFENGESIKYEEMVKHTFVVQSESIDSFDAVIMWWDLDMDGTAFKPALGKYVISTAPKWWNPYAQWRDHWMQAVYYLPQSLSVRHNQEITLNCFHDEFSFWFALDDCCLMPLCRFEYSGNFYEYGLDVRLYIPNCVQRFPPYCDCGIHITCSRNAIYRLNTLDVDERFEKFLQKNCFKKNVIAINSGSLTGVMAAKYASFVTVLEYNKHFRSALMHYADANSLTNLKFIKDEDELNAACYMEADLILSEPYFFSSLLPWDNLRIWCTVQTIDDAFGTSKAIPVLPSTFVLRAMPVYLEDLWKIVAPVGVVEGFNLSAFDDICEKARNATDDLVEPHSLWEYANFCAGDAQTIITVTMEDTKQKANLAPSKKSATLHFRPKTANAVALWVHWHSDDYQLHNGPLGEPEIGKRINWTVGERQGLYFFPEKRRLDDTCNSVKITAELSLQMHAAAPTSPVQLSFEFGSSSKPETIIKTNKFGTGATELLLKNVAESCDSTPLVK